MTKNNQREDLRQLLKSPQLRLVEYSADPFVQRRVGQVLGKASMHNHIKQRAATNARSAEC
jgi:DNA replication initiation complex subunit (GINS family)